MEITSRWAASSREVQALESPCFQLRDALGAVSSVGGLWKLAEGLQCTSDNYPAGNLVQIDYRRVINQDEFCVRVTETSKRWLKQGDRQFLSHVNEAHRRRPHASMGCQGSQTHAPFFLLHSLPLASTSELK